jgi:hypothetical protein
VGNFQLKDVYAILYSMAVWSLEQARPMYSMSGLVLISFVTMGKSFDLSEAQFLHLTSGAQSSHLTGWLLVLKGIQHT